MDIFSALQAMGNGMSVRRESWEAGRVWFISGDALCERRPNGETLNVKVSNLVSKEDVVDAMLAMDWELED